MNATLPDVSLADSAPNLSPLAWVGMQGIDLPITVVEPDYHRELHARVDVQVDLPTPHVKGIHMSRLYRLLNTLSQGEAIAAISMRHLLQAMVTSHQDCNTSRARVRLSFALLVRRSALVAQGLSGLKPYPARLDALLIDGVFTCRAQVTVGYSSTCPCSAAISRQIVGQSFLDDFGQQSAVNPADVAEWLRQHATLATPHSQRSEALVTVDIPGDSDTLGLLALIDHIEQAVGTPVQTAVKRANEQAFAALNGQNLMFVEDATRRIEAALAAYSSPIVHVRHLESLHPHNAVAWAIPASEGGST